MKRRFFQPAVVSILLYGCTTWTLTKRLEKKAWRQLHKNAANNIEQVLEAAPPPRKAPTIRPPTSHHENYSRSRYLSFFALSYNYTLWSARHKTPKFSKFSFFLLIIIKSGRLAEIRWSVCMSKSERSLRISFVWSNSDLLPNSQWITLLTQSCLVLYSFWVNLLHSLILRWIVSSLLPHNLHLLISCVLSNLTMIWLVLMALFFAAIRRDSVSLKRFPFLSQVHVFSSEVKLIYYYYYYNYFTLGEFLKSVLVNGPSLKFNWHQVSSSLQLLLLCSPQYWQVVFFLILWTYDVSLCHLFGIRPCAQ